MERCQPLREYTWTVEKIRENMKNMEPSQAVSDALERMPGDFVIKPYLFAHRAEVEDMLLTEYNEAEAMELFREEGREEGRESALLEGLANLMASTGCTAERASEMLGLPAEERQRYLEKLKGIPPKIA